MHHFSKMVYKTVVRTYTFTSCPRYLKTAPKVTAFPMNNLINYKGDTRASHTKHMNQIHNMNSYLRLLSNISIISLFSEGSINVKFDAVFSNNNLDSNQIKNAVSNSLSPSNNLAGSTIQVNPDSITATGLYDFNTCSINYPG